MHTKEEVTAIMQELHEALHESIEADRAETEAKQAKAKAHIRLLNAKQALSAIKFN